MKKYILKFLYLVATAKHSHIRKDYRYYIRDNYFCRINQFQYFFKDYVGKRKYKVIEFQGEFDQELRYVVHFAYWHHLNGTLSKTISCKGTKELYFFSQDHEERYQERDWQASYLSYEIPNMSHSVSFDYSKWARVPYKEHFKNNLFVYDKPLLVIANKYNMEWDKPPLNFLSKEDLDSILQSLGHKYQIVYNRPLSTHIVGDNSETLDLNEHSWLREKHPDVLLTSDLYELHKGKVNNFNHLQLMLYANCDWFISMHGGTAALASCFGGTNLILSIGDSKEEHLDEFNTIFPALSGARILHANSKKALFSHIEASY